MLTVIENRILEKFPDAGLNLKYHIRSEANPRCCRQSGPATGETRLLKMLYADDLILLEDRFERIEAYMEIICQVFADYGLIIAAEKTKIMSWGHSEESFPSGKDFKNTKYGD